MDNFYDPYYVLLSFLEKMSGFNTFDHFEKRVHNLIYICQQLNFIKQYFYFDFGICGIYSDDVDRWLEWAKKNNTCKVDEYEIEGHKHAHLLIDVHDRERVEFDNLDLETFYKFIYVDIRILEFMIVILYLRHVRPDEYNDDKTVFYKAKRLRDYLDVVYLIEAMELLKELQANGQKQ